jgi:polysaccharide export outer membrane protein
VKIAPHLVLTLAGLALAGCAATQRPPVNRATSADTARVQQLLAERAASAASSRTIAPGDRLKIQVANLDELSGEFTVAKDGTVSLPLAGDLSVAGKRDVEVAEMLRARLAEQYLQSPQVLVTVIGYQGQRVAVIGAVRSPGFYDIQKQGETILDVITQAGGIAGSAGPKVYFSPAQGSSSAIEPIVVASADTDIASALKGRNPVEIDLTDLYQGRPVAALGIPVRDGDLVAVQQGGEIFVGGWVEKPNVYALQPAMTVTQAVTKAGGLHFAASSNSVTISRGDVNGHLQDYRLDYPAMAAGTEQDVLLEPGDKIYVGVSSVKVVPWSVYAVVATVVRVGVGAGVALF